jgi:hypothetical protein
MIRVALFCLFCALSFAAWGQLRSIPVEAKRGEIRSLGNMDVEIDGKAMRLSPGAQIRDAGNMIVLPTAVPAGAKVKYQVDPQNLVNRVWILSPQELAQPDPRQ